ncbi:MAG TPA: twin-arginine translocase TatA/TatE family subunit [Terriglobales bacterium]|nr:twin-arginine translocase TatA/TatE family subunit [Terriglobales bacterium]
MSFADTTVLFILALLLFGPKKLPQIARQVGKALGEFKRASNEFKAQIEAEISQLEFEERRKEQEEKAQLKPQPVTESVQSSRFALAEQTSENPATENPVESPSESAAEAPAPSEDLNSPAHSTHA